MQSSIWTNIRSPRPPPYLRLLTLVLLLPSRAPSSATTALNTGSLGNDLEAALALTLDQRGTLLHGHSYQGPA